MNYCAITSDPDFEDFKYIKIYWETREIILRRKIEDPRIHKNNNNTPESVSKKEDGVLNINQQQLFFALEALIRADLFFGFEIEEEADFLTTCDFLAGLVD